MTDPSDRPLVRFDYGPRALDPGEPYLTSQDPSPRRGFEPADVPELTPDQAALSALEERLADVRRLMVHASHIRCSLRGDVQALRDLVAELHHQVMRRIYGGRTHG